MTKYRGKVSRRQSRWENAPQLHRAGVKSAAVPPGSTGQKPLGARFPRLQKMLSRRPHPKGASTVSKQ